MNSILKCENKLILKHILAKIDLKWKKAQKCSVYQIINVVWFSSITQCPDDEEAYSIEYVHTVYSRMQNVLSCWGSILGIAVVMLSVKGDMKMFFFIRNPFGNYMFQNESIIVF